MRIDQEFANGLSESEITELQNKTVDDLEIEEGIYVRDYIDDECNYDEFYLFAYGKYAKKLRQVFKSLEDELKKENS